MIAFFLIHLIYQVLKISDLNPDCTEYVPYVVISETENRKKKQGTSSKKWLHSNKQIYRI